MSEAREAEQAVEQVEEKPVEGQDQEQTTEQEQKPSRRPWYMDRIDQETRRRTEATARVEELEKQTAALRASMEALVGGKSQPNGEQKTYTVAEVQAEIDRQAAIKVAEALDRQAETEFTLKCNEIAAQGRRQFDDFDAMRDVLIGVGALNPDKGQRAFLEAVIELPNGAAVLHKLGSQPEEAIRLMRMKPMGLAIALSELAREVKAEAEKPKETEPKREPRVSNAPRPPVRVDGTASPRELDLADKNLSMEEFIRRRDEQDKARMRH